MDTLRGMDETRTLKVPFNGREIAAKPLTGGQFMVLSTLNKGNVLSNIGDLLDVLRAAVGQEEFERIKDDLKSGAVDSPQLNDLIIALGTPAKDEPEAADEDAEFAEAEARFKALLAQRKGTETNG